MSLDRIHEQHQQLELLSRQLCQRINRPPFDYESLDSAILELIHLYRRHFIYEEVQMAKSAYPDYQQHKKLHGQFLSRLQTAFQQWQETREYRVLKHVFSDSLIMDLEAHLSDSDQHLIDHLSTQD
ncbi:hemerythrin family protein [Paraferrimonas haliotis]|uniref:Hemerythrin-like domain-containing protein n=1 Tax=Paraferrimonas haliotis TaxID=2013866 RepID=A0AA37TUH7_9GAMM|nr:hemerythrin family protein [Paraferrimonas haliotis]GLS84717.1 hypothetical protein GCM10007894_26940 [Paraferrimonas haliotis]